MIQSLKAKKFLSLVLIFLTYLVCLWPSLPQESPGIPHMDKIVHTMIYAIHALWNFPFFKKKIHLFLLFSVIGLSIEGLQALTVTRSFEIADLAANSFGLFLGISLALLVTRHSER